MYSYSITPLSREALSRIHEDSIELCKIRLKLIGILPEGLEQGIAGSGSQGLTAAIEAAFTGLRMFGDVELESLHTVVEASIQDLSENDNRILQNEWRFLTNLYFSRLYSECLDLIGSPSIESDEEKIFYLSIVDLCKKDLDHNSLSARAAVNGFVSLKNLVFNKLVNI